MNKKYIHIYIITLLLLLLKYLFGLEVMFQNNLNNNILFYLVIFCIFTFLLKKKSAILFGTIFCIIIFNLFIEHNYHYTNITSPKSTNSILITEYDLPLNSEMIIYRQIFLCIYKKEIYRCTEYGFYPFFEEKAQYNWIAENQIELKYTLDKLSDISMAHIINITFD